MARFMKKWWIEVDAHDVNGNPVQFRGWFNTIHVCESEGSLPQDVFGTVTLSRDEVGFHGHFDLDRDLCQCTPEHFQHNMQEGAGNYLVGNWYVRPMSDEERTAIFSGGARYAADRILDEVRPIRPIVHEVTMDIQSCLKLDKTYVEVL